MHFSLPHVGKRFDREQDLSLGNWKKKKFRKRCMGLNLLVLLSAPFLQGHLMTSVSGVRLLILTSACVLQLNLMAKPIMSIYYAMSTTSYVSAITLRSL